MSNITFEEIFEYFPTVSACAPARANLIGEHTDYNDGFVLPFPLKYEAVVSIGRKPCSGRESIALFSTLIREPVRERHIDDDPCGDWTDYLIGTIRIFKQTMKCDVKGLDIFVESTIPLGCGISSSAALEIAVLRALCRLFSIDISDRERASLGQRAENDYVGMPCGIMDQLASSVGRLGDALFIDCRTLEMLQIPLIKTVDFLIVSSGISHQLVDGGYLRRVQECEKACSLLGVRSLRDIDTLDHASIESLPEPYSRRVHHVIFENFRVLEAVKALRAENAVRLGELMNMSHISQRDNYDITITETDNMVKDALRFGALGARQMGGGWGGALIVLLPSNHRDIWWSNMQPLYPEACCLP